MTVGRRDGGDEEDQEKGIFDIFRSEKMSHLLMYIQREAAHQIVEELGHLGCIEFQDLNADSDVPQSKKPMMKDIARCAELERQLRYFYSCCKEERVTVFTSEHLETLGARAAPALVGLAIRRRRVGMFAIAAKAISAAMVVPDPISQTRVVVPVR